MRRYTSARIASGVEIRRSSVVLTEPSAEFSTGTIPHCPFPRSTSSKTSGIVAVRHGGDPPAEVGQGRLVAEGGLRSQEGDGGRRLEGAGGGEDLPEDPPEGRLRKDAVVELLPDAGRPSPPGRGRRPPARRRAWSCRSRPRRPPVR